MRPRGSAEGLMPLEIRPGVTIRRPRREVAAVMLDPRHEASWLETFARVEADDHDPPRRLVRFLLFPILMWTAFMYAFLFRHVSMRSIPAFCTAAFYVLAIQVFLSAVAR